jgi:acetyltransferase
MTTRNLDAAMRPGSIAIVGASEREGSVGAVVLANIRAAGYRGDIYPINPKYTSLFGLACYPDAAALPKAPDLAIVVTPPGAVPKVVGELARRGTRAAVVITAGVGSEGGLRQAMLDAARPSLMRIIGPNTIGILAPTLGLNASFTHIAPKAGGLGLISQSGAVLSSIVDWAAAEDVGFSQLISLGDMADVDVGDCLNYLAADPETKAILMYLESLPDPRKFMSAARAAARVKPVIAVKPGRHQEAAAAAATHTGALAGADNVVDAALRRAGVIRVNDLEDLFYAAEITARFPPLTRGRLAIVTNGGGAGVLAVDRLLDEGGELATLSPATIAALDTHLPPTWSHANPIDIIGDAPPERYAQAVVEAAADPGVDAVLVMNCPTALASPVNAATAVAQVAKAGLVNGKPLLATWLGKQAAEPARAVLRGAGVATADTPAAAAQAVSLLTRWSQLRTRLERIPESTGQVPADRALVTAIVDAAAAEGRRVLDEHEAKQVLRAYGLPVPEIRVVTDEAAVEAAATEMLAQYDALVVKLHSRTITHKSDVGGVALNLATPQAAFTAARTIREKLAAIGQEAALDGFTVQPMVKMKSAEEVLVGLSTDPSFGPIVLFGAGGTAVEVVKDSATGLAPLDEVLAGDLIDSTRIAKLLAGYRDRKPADRQAIIRALLGLSQLAVDFPAIVGADINPLLVNADGAMALDARIEIDPSRIGIRAPNPRLAIRPYPMGWDEVLPVGGARYRMRPIRPADAGLYPEFLTHVSAEHLRLRFLTPMKTISGELLIRLSQLDYDRDIAFVALDEATGALSGISRYAADPDHETAEFGVLVRSDLQGQGLGRALMLKLIAYARAEGLKRLTGRVLRENSGMLQLAAELGFTPATSTSGDAVVEVVLELGR